MKEAAGVLDADLAPSGEVATTTSIESLVAMRFAWGVGNGT